MQKSDKINIKNVIRSLEVDKEGLQNQIAQIDLVLDRRHSQLIGTMQNPQTRLQFPEVKSSGINLSLTISEGRDIVRDRVVSGIKCPCCDQLVKLRQRSISIAHVYFLSNLFDITMAEYMFDYNKLKEGNLYIHKDRASQGKAKTATDYNILKYWGLIAPMPRDAGEKSAGFWKLTVKGYEFLRGEIIVAKYIYTFDSRVYPTPEHLILAEYGIKVSDVVKGFDYQETLMNY